MVMAFAGAVLLHGVALLLFALVVALAPPAPPETAPPPDEPIRLEVTEDEPTPTPPPLLAVAATPTPTPKRQQIVDATGEDTTETPSPSAAVSDRTTRASSSETGDNRAQGPAQAGRKLASFRFDPSPPTNGMIGRMEATAPTPLPETAPALPQPDRFAPQTPAPRRSTPSTPAPTATPAPSVADDEFAMAMATPKPTPEDPFDPSIRSTSPPLPKPSAKSTPTPHVASARSAENGGGANRSAGGVETVATPSARYGQQVSKIIKFIWSRSVESRQDLTYGSTVIHCLIDKDGLVLSPRVASNTSDTLFASTALQAVVVARLPPMPSDVVTELEGGRLSLDITFDLLMPQEAARR